MLGEGAARVELAITASREAAEFARLVRAQLPGAYRLAGFLLGDEAEAEDRFGAWIDRIVANVCHDRLRSRGKHRVLRSTRRSTATAPAIRSETRSLVTSLVA